jgi:hypothetical protein
VAVLWVLRTYGEVLLLAQERAARYLGAVAAGVVANVAVGVVLVRSSGSTGAAMAALAAEVVVLVLTFSGLRTTVLPATRRLLVPVVLLGAGAALTAMAGRSLPLVASAVVTGAWCLGGVVLLGLPLLGERRSWRQTDGSSAGSGAHGDHADVGEEVRGDLPRDAVEAVEYLAGPADHL